MFNQLIRNQVLHLFLLLVIAILLLQCNPTGTAVADLPETTMHTAKTNPPKAGTMFLYPERIPLKDGGFHNAERGMMFVPMNRSKKKTDVIAVEVYRFKANDKANSNKPPIFYFHGGPSFKGLERSLEKPGTFEKQWKQFLDISDLVIVGQRGIGSSKPTTLIDDKVAPQSPDQPIDYSKMTQDFQNMLSKEKKTWEDLGVDLNGFTVLEAAEDVNAVRKALGYNKIIIWGGSFGSHWALAFMRKYPELVERSIMRGMEGPDHTYDHPGHIWNVYKRVAENAEQSPDLASSIPKGGLIKALETVIERADKKPFKVKVDNQEVLFDGQSIRKFSRGYTRRLNTWPAHVIAMYNGDFEIPARSMIDDFKDENRKFRTASYWMLDCGSGITPERLAAHEADPAMHFIPRIGSSYKMGCSIWNSDLGDDFRQNFESEIPTVIVQGTWDTSTPYENAVELMPYFKNSKFITVKRGPHSTIRAAFRASEPFKKSLLQFAATGDFSILPDELEIPAPKWKVPGE